MSEAVQTNKNIGLIRRISRGASNTTSKLIRRRQSSNSVTNRNQSSGPVTVWRKSGVENDLDPGLDGDDEDFHTDPLSLYGLGLSSESTLASSAPESKKPKRTEGGIAPIVPLLLRNGTQLDKVTKRKRKPLLFWLDIESAKVSWDLSNPSKGFYVDDIQQIRLGDEARNYREEFQIPDSQEPCWFTIIYADPDRSKGRPVKTIHLIAPDPHLFELWTSTLDDLSRYRHNLMKGLAGPGQDEKTLHGHWKCEMAKRCDNTPATKMTETLDLPGVEALCRSLHINCSSNLIRAQFDKADSEKTGFLDYDEFRDFVRRLKERSDLKEIYKTLTVPGQEGFDIDRFLGFLQFTQGVDVSADPAQWRKIFNKFVRKASVKSPATEPASAEEPLLYMNFGAFCSFLFSDSNSIVPTKPVDVKLDRPINEYFISSSHNTYLLGRQIAGSSSTEAYIRALQRACRCVEIDCWDGPDGKPIVLHGRTMTSSVMFSDCISAISKYAFVESPYPLTLSLEVHCNAAQQQSMVDIMQKELGDRLVKKPCFANASTLPSPEDLRNKILIKVKSGPDLFDKETRVDLPYSRRQRSVSSPYGRPQIRDNTYTPNVPLSSNLSTSPPDYQSPLWGPSSKSATVISMSSATDESDTGYTGMINSQKTKAQKPGKIIRSLGDLAIYTRGLKYDGSNTLDNTSYNHIYSFEEQTFSNLCHDPASEVRLEKHNVRYLMRVYPSKFRYKSTNPDPLTFWRRGVQMVALNWQTNDLGMQINEAMFAGGADRTGFVLKPEELRQTLRPTDPTFGPMSPGPSRLPKQLIRFSVEMISAQQLPLPRGSNFGDSLDPYVEIEMFSAEGKGKELVTGEGGQDARTRNGMAVISAVHRRRSVVVPSNGYNPVFNDHFKLSLETRYPSLVFVRWTVWDSADGRNYNKDNALPLATFTAKLSSLEQGYRHLPLYDHNGDQFLFSTLFCKIVKEEPVLIERDELLTEKVGGRFRAFGQAMFKRTMSIDRKRSKESLRKRIDSDANSHFSAAAL